MRRTRGVEEHWTTRVIERWTRPNEERELGVRMLGGAGWTDRLKLTQGDNLKLSEQAQLGPNRLKNPRTRSDGNRSVEEAENWIRWKRELEGR